MVKCNQVDWPEILDTAVDEATRKEVHHYKIGDSLGLSAMDELVNQMVQPRGATWQQGY